MKRQRIACLAVIAVCLTISVTAAQQAIIVLNTGQRHTGTLVRPIVMADGKLYLGVNDDQLTDNLGTFRVVITR